MLKDVNPEIIDKFTKFLEFIIGSMFSEKMTHNEKKEAAYLSKFILERFHEILEQYETYKKFPLMQVLFLGDNTGKTEIQFRATPEPEMLRGWKLREAAKLIRAACAEWELKYTDPDFEEAWGTDVPTEYSALQQYLKNVANEEE